MRKKIALLLAFSMILSIVPMNVFASLNPLAGQPTGALWERSYGPATNVFNIGDGTLVIEQRRMDDITSRFGTYATSDTNYNTRSFYRNSDDKNLYTATLASGNNLRSILASLDYFANRGGQSDYVASIRMEIHNARGFAANLMPSWWLGLGSLNPALDDNPGDPRPRGAFSDDTFADVLLGEIARQFNMDVDKLNSILINNGGGQGGLKGLFDALEDPDIRIGDAIKTSSGAAVSAGTDSIEKITSRGVSNTWGDSTSSGYDEMIEQVEKALNQLGNNGQTTTGTGANSVSNRPIANLRFLPLYIDNSVLFFAMLVPVWENYPGMGWRMNPTQMDLILVRNTLDIPNNNSAPVMLPVPIDYITSPDTNSSPVYLAFQTRGGWPAAGQSGARTDLTTVSESRFGLSLNTLDNNSDLGAPKVFHRYGRADIDPIRISEATQSAFSRGDWWVEMNIVTPGFYWAKQSEEITQSTTNPREDNLQTRYQAQGDYSRSSTGRDIRSLTLLNGSGVDLSGGVERTPADGSNRFRTLSFPLRMNGWSNQNRMVNDWFQVSGLSIAADDRAKNGDVEVEVRLWSTVSTGTGSSTTTGTGGSWQPLIFEWLPSAGNPNFYVWTPAGGNLPIPTPTSGLPSTGTAGQIITATTGADADTRWVYGTDVNGNRTIVGVSNSNEANPPSGYSPSSLVGERTGWFDDFSNYTGNSDTVTDTDADRIYSGHWVWMPSNTTITTPGTSGRYIRSGTTGTLVGKLVVARYGQIGLDLYRDDRDDLNDFQLRTGMMDWGYDTNNGTTGINSRYGRILVGSEPNKEYHETARVVLEEQVPGSLPATGAHPTTYTFHEGIQVLGAHFWIAGGPFIDEWDTNDYVWFGQEIAEADNFLNASINRNTMTIRPEMGEINVIDAERIRRYTNAKITAQFYLSIRPGFEYLFGEDIDVTVTSGTVESPFSGSEIIALAWDPISVDTDVIVLDDSQIEAAFGIVRAVGINDITVTETRAGELLPGSQIWLGVEGGSSRGWNPADSISLSAKEVTVVGDSQMQVSQPRLDSHGVYVEVIRPARNDGAQVVFSGVEISGRVVPDQEYNIIVAGDAIAANWSEFLWLSNGEGVAVRNVPHGFFIEEPYATPAFAFQGTDFYQPPPVVTQPATPPGGDNNPPPARPSFAPITLSESTASYTSQRTGETFNGPPLILVPNIEDPSFQTSYVMFAVMADLLGIDGTWDGSTGTFSDGVTTVSLSNGATSAQVNGIPREIRTALGSSERPGGLRADARIINDRFYVPITFFSYVVTEFPIMVQWNGGNPGSRSVTVMPRP